MIEIREMTQADMRQCAAIYQSAYEAEPWNENYPVEMIEEYIGGFMKSNSMRSFVIVDNGNVVGLALTILIPGMGRPYLRIEDFCIDAQRHRKGCGSRFIELIMNEAEKMGCDSLLLGTQKEFPAYRFYLKNGFQEIESVLLYREIGQ